MMGVTTCVTRASRLRCPVGNGPPERWGEVHDRDAEAAARLHLNLMRLSEFAETTIYSRWRFLVRLDHYFAGRPLLELTEDELLVWLSSLELTPGTVAHYVSHAHAFYGWALEHNLVAENPAARLPIPKRARRLPRPISENDLDFAVQMASPRIRPWLVLAGWAGLRAKEVALLARENVLDTATPPVIIVAYNATKGRNERAIYATEYVLEALYEHGLPNTGWCFRRHDNRPGPNAPSTVSELANKHLRACGIAATFHQLRHRFATQLYAESRGDILGVQKALGHADPASTAGYAAVNNQAMAEAIARIRTPPRLRAMPSKQLSQVY